MKFFMQMMLSIIGKSYDRRLIKNKDKHKQQI
jgi:hypothetical protein